MEQQQSHEDCFVSYFSGHIIFTADGSIMPMYLRGRRAVIDVECPWYKTTRCQFVAISLECASFSSTVANFEHRRNSCGVTTLCSPFSVDDDTRISRPLIFKG
ncbi:hypothetical protein NC652_002885 [Populus alba x Populus x berolinensis]|nr:hypothetical protein NC652_002885 [Populus alba x Populus x berolinensis]